jgi:hypothetical protein
MRQLIVCEKTNRWAVALRWALHGSGTRVYETRSWPDCWQAWRNAPDSALALQLRRDNVTDLVRHLTCVREQAPQALIAVLAEREMRACEWLLREAGALHVACSPGDLGPLARLLVRALRDVPPAASPEGLALRARLPWGD